MQAQAAARFAPAFIFSRSVAILLALTVLCLLVAAVFSGIIFGHNFFSVQKNN